MSPLGKAMHVCAACGHTRATHWVHKDFPPGFGCRVDCDCPAFDEGSGEWDEWGRPLGGEK